MELVVAQRSRLTKYLIVKSIIELLFVAALAVGFYLIAFTPYFRGSLDVADERNVAGWVVNEAEPQARVEVQLYIDGKFVADRLAELPRPDVLSAGRSQDDAHGFVFETPSLAIGEHEARVFAVHESGRGKRRTLQLIGNPRLFRVGVDEKPQPPVSTDQR